MEIERKIENVTSIAAMDPGTVFKFANEYFITTDAVDSITGGYVRCVNLQTGALRSIKKGTVCEYFTESKLVIG